MPGDENVPVGDLLGDAGFFGAVDEVVEEDAEAAAIIRAKAAYPLGEIVGALELFDDHAFGAKVRPHTFSMSSASWIPSTQIRLARATRAGTSPASMEPLAVIVGAAGSALGATRRHGTPLPSMSARTDPSA